MLLGLNQGYASVLSSILYLFRSQFASKRQSSHFLSGTHWFEEEPLDWVGPVDAVGQEEDGGDDGVGDQGPVAQVLTVHAVRSLDGE